MPAWCNFRDAARAARNAREAADLAAQIVNLRPQEGRFQNSLLTIFGEHNPNTIAQMRNCMAIGNAVKGVICADGHLGYAQPVGGVIAYEKKVSISGVGFDIGCGNMAIRLDTSFIDIESRVAPILADVRKVISFGVGRVDGLPATARSAGVPRRFDEGVAYFEAVRGSDGRGSGVRPVEGLSGA
jgi:tRNA-splicing ligase RtcB